MTNAAILLVLLLSLHVTVSRKGYHDICAKKIKEIVDCFYNAPSSCDNWSKNKLLVCAKGVAENLQTCDDETAFKIINFQIASYRIADTIICQGNDTTDATSCDHLVLGVPYFWRSLTPGFLTPKGCMFFKTYIYTLGYSAVLPECYLLVDQYLTRIFNLSKTCGSGVNEDLVPTQAETDNMNFVYHRTGDCVYYPNSIPGCNRGTKSPVIRCVESWAKGKIINPNLKAIEASIMKVAEKREEVFCNNSDIRAAYILNHRCADNFWETDWRLIEKVGGFYTAEGCEGLKYYEYIRKGDVMVGECFFFRKYWDKMNAALPCTDEK